MYLYNLIEQVIEYECRDVSIRIAVERLVPIVNDIRSNVVVLVELEVNNI